MKMKIDNYQNWAKELFGGACYAACISWISNWMSDKISAIDITRDILAGVEKGYIEDDGFVSEPHLFYNYCLGKKLAKDVRKLPYEPQPFNQIVCWKWKDKTHFVVMRDDKVVFDPAGDSNTVKYGKIDSIREFVVE